jgi:hypothetical protein
MNSPISLRRSFRATSALLLWSGERIAAAFGITRKRTQPVNPAVLSKLRKSPETTARTKLWRKRYKAPKIYRKAPRREIWFRKIYADDVMAKRVKTIFRPGWRVRIRTGRRPPKALAAGKIPNASIKAQSAGEHSRVRIIDTVGTDATRPKIIGRRLLRPNKPIVITSVKVMRFGKIKAHDLTGSTSNIGDRNDLKYEMGSIYNLSPRRFARRGIWVTITKFEYLQEKRPPRRHHGLPAAHAGLR